MSLLGGLSADDRDALLSLGRTVALENGATLIREGECSYDVYVLLSGWYKVLATGDSGREVVMAIRTGGDIVGELASLDGQPRIATVRAVGHCETRRIGQSDFRRYLASHPDAALLVTRSVAEKLRSATRRRLELSTSSLPERLARILVELGQSYGLATQEGIVVGVALTQTDLAALVGAADPTVHRALTALRRDGVISTKYRKIVIRDLAELHRRAVGRSGPGGTLAASRGDVGRDEPRETLDLRDASGELVHSCHARQTQPDDGRHDRR